MDFSADSEYRSRAQSYEALIDTKTAILSHELSRVLAE
jgi:hypothetical protein